MMLLLDFLCRFGWGLAVALVLTPMAAVPAGFFRVNTLVVLGVATFAALVAGSVAPGTVWPLVTAAIVAWVGSIAWLAGRGRAGFACCAACAGLLALATVLVATGEPPESAGGAATTFIRPCWPPAAVALVSGLVSGLTVHAMLLGHWYLNAPGMRIDVLRRMIDVALAAWGVQLLLSIVEVVPTFTAPAAAGGPAALTLLALRWLGGLAGLPVLLVLARKTLDVPNTQSATGILYVACLAAILGELSSQLVRAAV